MSNTVWRDDDLRLEAESLMDEFGGLWPVRCEGARCTKIFPRQFRKDQTGKAGGVQTRRFRCSGCKSTFSISHVLKILRPVKQDINKATLAFTAELMNPSVIITQPPTQVQPLIPNVFTPVVARPRRSPRSLHVSDLDSVRQEDDSMSEHSEHSEGENEGDGASLLYHYPSARPADFNTPPSAQPMIYGSPTFALPPGQSFGQGPFLFSPSQQHSSFPTHLSSWQPTPNSGSPSLHPSQWSPMSAGSQGVPFVNTAGQQWVSSIRQESPGVGNSVAHGKRPLLAASVWPQKRNRPESAVSEEYALVFQQALDEKDRQVEELQAQNQTLTLSIQTLINQVQELTSALKNVPQVQPVAPAPAPTQPAPTPAPAPAPAPAQVPVAIAAPAAVVNTYAGAARQGLSEAQLAIIQSMRPPPRPFKARQPANAIAKPDRPPVQIYFSGVQSCALKTFKERLRALRIRTSQIYNISFVGKSICEFLIDASYQSQFIESMSGFTFRHLPNYDPAVPQDPNVTPETRDILKQAYFRRLTNMATTTNRGFVREVFLGMLSAAGAETPMDLPPIIAPLPAQETSTEVADITMETAAEDTAGAIDEGTNTVRSDACGPPLPSPSNE